MSYVHGDDHVDVVVVCSGVFARARFWLRDFPVTRPFTSTQRALHGRVEG